MPTSGGFRDQLRFFGVLWQAHHPLTATWWALLVTRGLMVPLFAIAMGRLVHAIQSERSLTLPLTFVGVVFFLLLSLGPLHTVVGQNLGSRTAGWMRRRLARDSVAPPGIGHLEHPGLKNDLTLAQDFDRGISGPPLSISMDFIANGLNGLLGGALSALLLFGYNWWAPLVIAGGWLGTQWLLRESGVWKDRLTDEVREAQRHADYMYRLAVNPPASRELRLFGLSDWTLDRFVQRRRRLFDLQWRATRMRERPVVWSLLLVLAANLLFFWSLASDLNAGSIELGNAVIYAQAAIAASALAFSNFLWALDGSAAPANAVLRLGPGMRDAGALPRGSSSAAGMPARGIRFRDVTFTYPVGDVPVLERFDLTIPAGSSLAIVGQNGAGKTTIAKLLCRLYDPQGGAIEVDGIDLRELDLDQWRSRLAAVFQDFVRFELPLRDNVAPLGAPDDAVLAALDAAGASGLAGLDTILSKAYAGGTDLSGGQWQRVALARALNAVRLGAGVVLLDEPTAQLDVRGEAEIFERILTATRGVTTILVSHRFSTVRHADRICVIEDGRVVELGTHQELMAQRGRYWTMFDLQASRFGAEHDEEGVAYELLT
jgi:ABC-type multidrug transport system fused ATPase/permease subunit